MENLKRDKDPLRLIERTQEANPLEEAFTAGELGVIRRAKQDGAGGGRVDLADSD